MSCETDANVALFFTAYEYGAAAGYCGHPRHRQAWKKMLSVRFVPFLGLNLGDAVLCFAELAASKSSRPLPPLERPSRSMLRRVAAHAEEGRGASRGASPSDAAFFDSADDMDLLSLLANSPTAKALGMGFDPKSVSSGSMMRQFVDQLARLDGTDSPSPVPSGAPPRSPSPKLPSKLTKLPHGAVRPTPGRSSTRGWPLVAV